MVFLHCAMCSCGFCSNFQSPGLQQLIRDEYANKDEDDTPNNVNNLIVLYFYFLCFSSFLLPPYPNFVNRFIYSSIHSLRLVNAKYLPEQFIRYTDDGYFSAITFESLFNYSLGSYKKLLPSLYLTGNINRIE